MSVVEDVMVIGSDRPLRSADRDEHLLLASPYPSKIPIKLWRDQELLPVVHYSLEYDPQPFAPPRGVYENSQLRVEWQLMNGRQPFYHRNCDVDEISYQINGERTLMTELGVIEHRAGEFSRIPQGVGHDNFGRGETHLLFYLPAPVVELAAPARTSQPVSPPFPGWEPGQVNEAVTQCMGTVGHDLAVFPVDEKLLLDRVHAQPDRMPVHTIGDTIGRKWLYATSTTRLGFVNSAKSEGPRRYSRTLDADEVQYQISGIRTLVTQRGIVELIPGDLVRIPLGVAHTSITNGSSAHVTLLSHLELPQIAQTDRTADPYSPERLAAVTKSGPAHSKNGLLNAH